MKLIQLIGFASLVAVILLACLAARNRDNKRVERLVRNLLQVNSATNSEVEIPPDLPAPVLRYLKRALPQSVRPVRKVLIQQFGQLRTSTATGNWTKFSARQVVAPLVKGFVWDARVKLPLGMHLRVLDSYSFGKGSGVISLLSALTVSRASNEAELNSGSLHRYLAEAVWYPTALLPQFGVVWTAKDDRSALASLSDRGVSVSLEFRFNEADEIVSIYTPGRFGRFGGIYKKVAWEGHFSDYRRQDGFLIPGQGEVGWYEAGKLRLVWKGDFSHVQIQLD